MLELKYKSSETERGEYSDKVYFTCHKDDFKDCFEKITDCITEMYSCTVYYTEGMEDSYGEDREVLLGEMNLFVFPVTKRLLSEPSRAIDEDLSFALDEKIPILPIIMDEPSDIDDLYSDTNKFGMRHYLRWQENNDGFKEKLRKYLDAVLNKFSSVDSLKEKFAARMFMSYRKKDRRYAVELMHKIHSYEKMRYVSIWYDEFLRAGEDFTEEIRSNMNDSCAVILLVTKNLLEERNYVKEHEYPNAKNTGKRIIPVVMDDTDYDELKGLFGDEDMPPFIRPTDESFERVITEAVGVPDIISESDKFDKNFNIGYAYLHGVEVETNRELGIKLLTEIADNDHMVQMGLYDIYRTGDGVEQSDETAQYWARRYEECVNVQYEGDPLLRFNMILLSLRMSSNGDYGRAIEAAKKAVSYEVLNDEDLCYKVKAYKALVSSMVLGDKTENLAPSLEAVYDLILENPDIADRCLFDFYATVTARRNRSVKEFDIAILEKEYKISNLFNMSEHHDDLRIEKARDDSAIITDLSLKIKKKHLEGGLLAFTEDDRYFRLIEEVCRLHRSLPEMDYDAVFINRTDLALCYRERRDFRKAILCLEELRELQMATLPEYHEETLSTLMLLTVLYDQWVTQLKYSDKNTAKKAYKKEEFLINEYIRICDSEPAVRNKKEIDEHYRKLKNWVRRF